MLRRKLLKSFASLALSVTSKRIFAYAGSYSSPKGPEGSKGNGKGIYLFEMERSSGRLTRLALFENLSNPSWLSLHPSGNFLYAAEEISSYQGSESGAVTAYRIDRSSGGLTLLNTVSSQGAGPAHLSVHPAGTFVFVANYYGGTFAVLPIAGDGRLGPASDIKRDSGDTGPLRAANAPPGSFAISGHEQPHAHMIESDPTGQFVLGSDLGMDQIQVWKFDRAGGKLEAKDSTPIPGGDGPRHFAFHPNGRWLYSLQEEGSTLILFDYDPVNGSLTKRQQISSLPAGVAGTNFTSEVRVSSDGRFLYAANRLHDSIAVFTIASTGTLSFASETWTRGDYPRSFTIDPTGGFLYSCNQRSDVITCFRVNQVTGSLTFTGQYTPVGTPSIIVFLGT